MARALPARLARILLLVPLAWTALAAPPGAVRLRVLTLNMSGLRYPPQLGWMADQSDCAGRFRAVASRIRQADPPYDIVAIQELYRVSDLHVVTCDPRPFLEELERGPQGKPQRILFSPPGQRWKFEADGGIGVITPHTIEHSQAVRFAGSGGSFLAARGALFARVALRSSPLAVDTYVVHLSPSRRNAEQRRRELEALSKLIAAKSSSSGNPVLVLGDFNIEGPPHAGVEYGSILKLLGEPRDLWLEQTRTGAGYTFDCFANAIAAMRSCDYQARIDYIWIVTNRLLSGAGYQVRTEDVRTVEWRTDGTKPQPVSDHFGVEAFLSIGR